MTTAERPRDWSLLHAVRRVVESNYGDPRFRVPDIAKAVGLSERHLQRRLRELIGTSPARFLANHRLQIAAEMLHLGFTVGDVAQAVGYSSHAYFASRFRDCFGVTPSRYKASRSAGSTSRERKILAGYR